MVRLASEYLGTISLAMVTALIGWGIYVIVNRRKSVPPQQRITDGIETR